MSLVGIQFKFPDWEHRIKSREEEINRFIAAQMQFNRGMLFDQEGSYNGHPGWEPLKLRQGQILKKSGTLSKSMGPMNGDGSPGPSGIVRFRGDTVTIGTKLAYARLMNDGTTNLPGGVLRPTTADALVIPLPAGVYASDLAKEKAKSEGKSKKDLANKISEIQHQIRKSKSSKARKRLSDQLRRYQNRMDQGPKNEKVIFRKSVKIPARPFDTWTDQDAKDLEEALANKLAEILSGI